MEEVKKLKLEIVQLRERIRELEDEVNRLRSLKTEHRRAHPRKKILTIVNYATLDKSLSDYAHNISESGMYIGSKKPLPVGTKVSLSFAVPESDIPIKVKGEVVWIGRKGMGLRFKEVDESTKGEIKSILSKM